MYQYYEVNILGYEGKEQVILYDCIIYGFNDLEAYQKLLKTFNAIVIDLRQGEQLVIKKLKKTKVN